MTDVRRCLIPGCPACAAVDQWLAQRAASRRRPTGNRAAANAAARDGEFTPEVAPDGGSRSDAPVAGCPGASYAETA